MLANFFKNLFYNEGSLKNGLGLRLISLLAGIIIWTSVMNIQHPVMNVKFNARLEVMNEETLAHLGKSFSIPERDSIRINYSVKAENAGNVRQSDFRVYVNLNELDGDSGNLPVYIELLNDIQVEDYGVSPEQVRVVTDDIVSKQVSVSYNTIGSVASGLQLGSILYSPTEMYVTGPSAMIEIIEGIKFDIDLRDQNDSFSDTTSPYYIDRNGNKIDGPNIKRSAELVNFTVPIFSSKDVTINPVIVGSLSPGRELKSATVEPNVITLYGPKQLLDTIQNINLPVYDISGLNEDTEYEYNVSDIVPIGAISSIDGGVVTLKINIENNIVEKKNFTNGEHPGPKPTDEESDSDETSMEETIAEEITETAE